jgi:hypothetical protein
LQPYTSNAQNMPRYYSAVRFLHLSIGRRMASVVVPNALYAATDVKHSSATIDGEPVLFHARLTNKWYRYRAIDCCCKLTWIPFSISGIPLLGLPYLCCAASCREKEYASFSLALTQTALHYTLKQYGCGCCCQSTVKKSIPLDKIQVRSNR